MLFYSLFWFILFLSATNKNKESTRMPTFSNIGTQSEHISHITEGSRQETHVIIDHYSFDRNSLISFTVFSN
jgi:hypothetical protein